MEDLARVRGAPFEPRMESASNETVKQAVMAGIGISCISGHTLSLELLTGRLVTLRVEGFPVIRNWYAIHLRDRPLSPVAAAFRSYLTSHGAGIIDRVLGQKTPKLTRLSPRGYQPF